MTAQNRIDFIADLQFQYKESKKTTEELKAQIEREKSKLLESMRKDSIGRQNGKEFMAVRTIRTGLRLVDEASALAWLDNSEIADKGHYIGLKWGEFKNLAKQALKEDGEIPGGCELAYNETLMIREMK